MKPLHEIESSECSCLSTLWAVGCAVYWFVCGGYNHEVSCSCDTVQSLVTMPTSIGTEQASFWIISMHNSFLGFSWWFRCCNIIVHDFVPPLSWQLKMPFGISDRHELHSICNIRFENEAWLHVASFWKWSDAAHLC